MSGSRETELASHDTLLPTYDSYLNHLGYKFERASAPLSECDGNASLWLLSPPIDASDYYKLETSAP